MQEALESGVADLQFVHYQYEGFEHYDVVHLVGREIGLLANKKDAFLLAIQNSPLLNALQAEDLQEYRRLALEMVGIVAEETRVGECEGTETMEEHHESLESSSDSEETDESASGQSSEDDEDGVTSVPEGGPALVPAHAGEVPAFVSAHAGQEKSSSTVSTVPQGVPAPVFARAGQKRFCSTFNASADAEECGASTGVRTCKPEKKIQKAVALIRMVASPPKSSVTLAMTRTSSTSPSSRTRRG